MIRRIAFNRFSHRGISRITIFINPAIAAIDINVANHIKKRNEESQTRAKNTKGRTFHSAGSVDRPGPHNRQYRSQPYPGNTSHRPLPSRASGGKEHSSSSSFRTSFREKPPGPGKIKDDKPLHPSWEAKKKAKEKETLLGPTKGTKIKFG